MAIAFVNAYGQGNSNTDPTSHSVTLTAGSNLVVALLLCPTVAVTVAGGVTFGGTPMTVVESIASGISAVHIAYLYNPTTGSAQTVAWDVSATSAARSIVAEFSGADTSFTPFGEQASGTSTTPAVDITPTRADGVIVTGAVHQGDNVSTAMGSGQVGLVSTGMTDEGPACTMRSYELNTDTSLNAQSFTNPSSDAWVIASAFFAPPAAAASGGSGLTLLGVG